MTVEVDGTRHRGHLRNTWWEGITEDMKSYGPTQRLHKRRIIKVAKLATTDLVDLENGH